MSLPQHQMQDEEAEQLDPEEEERQRRAAIAARMARLGGARVGMSPPVFGRKPSIKRTETPKDEEALTGGKQGCCISRRS
jgi:hypothetical protein